MMLTRIVGNWNSSLWGSFPVYICPWIRFCYCIWVYLTVGLTWLLYSLGCNNYKGSLPFIGIARKNPLIILTLSICTRYFFFFLSCSIFLNQDDHSYPKKKCFAIFASIVVSSPLQSSNPNFEKLSKFLFTCLFTSICPSHL